MQPGRAAQPLTMPGGYGAARTRILPWTVAAERLDAAEHEWLAMIRSAGLPHVTPVWGTVHGNALYVTGIPIAAWAPDIARNPQASIHLERGSEVVIVHGRLEDIPSITDPDLAAAIVARWQAKYRRLVPDPGADGI